MSIPVTIFAESSLEECRRQMFSDLGQMRKMDEITLARFNLNVTHSIELHMNSRS